MATDWAAFGGLPPDLVKAGCGISGLYDLDPIRLCYLNDVLGLTPGPKAKFVKPYAELRTEMLRAVGEYASEVRARSFPRTEHTYSIEPEELEAYRRYLDQESLASSESFGGDWAATEI